MLVVSECLIGGNCKYNGGNNYHKTLIHYIKNIDVIPICPEVLGGLPVPRVPCEVVGGRVKSRDGLDVTKEFLDGAEKSLSLCKKYGVRTAILQSRSPSCGCGEIYDGTFKKQLIQGDGVTTKRLKENGIAVYDVEEIECTLYEYSYQTELGELFLSATKTGLRELLFCKEREKKESHFKRIRKETPLLKEAYTQLQEYFQGKRKEFQLPLEPKGTEFQRKVWKALESIPYGQTKSYGEIARMIGNEKASRAVGMANNKNPLSIFIPCHRVIGADGKLVGYGGGLDKKIYLLDLEKNRIINETIYDCISSTEQKR